MIKQSFKNQKKNSKELGRKQPYTEHKIQKTRISYTYSNR